MESVTNPLPAAGDFRSWQQRLPDHWSADERRAAERAYTLSVDDSGQIIDTYAMQAADLLLDLRLDADSVVAALLYHPLRKHAFDLKHIRTQFSGSVCDLLESIERLSVIGAMQQRIGRDPEKRAEQLENLRKMLLSMAQDVRVVLITLALKVCEMRTLDGLAPDQQKQIAREILDIFAPLANRLGIAQFKWELEDRALRALDPGVYKTLAKALYERRSDRERYINLVIKRLRQQLQLAGINAEVSGRAKHIYSIWRKMQRKQLPFEQIFDVHAVRIMVRTVADCYATLGMVHAQWKHIAQEFDDYIASPKENGYQSLHTAVVGPEGKIVEVQIRTSDMHKSAELGVAAHWRYKEGDHEPAQSFDGQISWLRQLFEWNEETLSDPDDFIEQLKTEAFRERVYVFTPKGEIIDLPQGATPLDFAYHIHTEVGHRCRGAKIDGRIVPLEYILKSGDQVAVLTTKEGGPSRDWLSPHHHYLHTARARSKVRHWLRQLDRDRHIAAGQALLEQEFQRLALEVDERKLLKVAGRYNFVRVDDLYAAIGSGDINVGSVLGFLQDLVFPPAKEPFVPLYRKGRDVDGGQGIKIRGVGDLLTQMAGCCKPVPFEPVIGFITQGRGVTVHRQDCANVLNLHSERLIEVDWGEDSQAAYSVDILIDVYDRSGLLRDITALLANARVNISALVTKIDQKTGMGRITATLEITDLSQLSQALDKLNQLPNIIEARRKPR